MSRVLLAGESWFVHSIHQKGFDSFTTSEFTLGGAEFVQALREAGHEVEHLPAHEIATSFPDSVSALRDRADVVVVSDVGANTFQVHPATFTRSKRQVDRSEVLRDFVLDGGGLVMVGGYMTFAGIDGKARWGRSPLAPVLPVTVLDRDDRVELPGGAVPSVLTAHPIVDGLPTDWPHVLGLNEVARRDGASVLAECAGLPFIAAGEYGAGRSVAFTTDLAPHWAPPEFVAWAGYGQLFDQIVRWAAGSGADDPATVGAGAPA